MIFIPLLRKHGPSASHGAPSTDLVGPIIVMQRPCRHFFNFCCEGFTTDVLACWGYPPKLKGIAVTSSAAQIVARISGHDSFCTWVGICSAEHLQRSNDFARKCPHYCSPTPPHPRSTCTHVIKTSSRNTFVSEAADDGNSFHQPVKDGSNKPRRFLMTPHLSSLQSTSSQHPLVNHFPCQNAISWGIPHFQTEKHTHHVIMLLVISH